MLSVLVAINTAGLIKPSSTRGQTTPTPHPTSLGGEDLEVVSSADNCSGQRPAHRYDPEGKWDGQRVGLGPGLLQTDIRPSQS